MESAKAKGPDLRSSRKKDVEAKATAPGSQAGTQDKVAEDKQWEQEMQEEGVESPQVQTWQKQTAQERAIATTVEKRGIGQKNVQP